MCCCRRWMDRRRRPAPSGRRTHRPTHPPNRPRTTARILENCEPVWDPADRNIYTTDGSSPNDVKRATGTSFDTAWQVDAKPRWRWAVNCLQRAYALGGLSVCVQTGDRVCRRSETWFTHLGGVSEIDVGQVVGHRVQGPTAVGGRGAEGDQLAPLALGDPQPPALERHPAAGVHPPALVVGP